MFGRKSKQDQLEQRLNDLEARLEVADAKVAFYESQQRVSESHQHERENLMALGIKLNDLKEGADGTGPITDELIQRYNQMYGGGLSLEEMRANGILLTDMSKQEQSVE